MDDDDEYLSSIIIFTLYANVSSLLKGFCSMKAVSYLSDCHHDLTELDATVAIERVLGISKTYWHV